MFKNITDSVGLLNALGMEFYFWHAGTVYVIKQWAHLLSNAEYHTKKEMTFKIIVIIWTYYSVKYTFFFSFSIFEINNTWWSHVMCYMSCYHTAHKTVISTC